MNPNRSRLEETLTDPDTFVSNADIKAFAMELLEEFPVPALDNANAVDRADIFKVLLRAAVGSMSINQVTKNTSDTPDRRAVVDRLHLVDSEELEATLNQLLGQLAMACLDPETPRAVAIDFMDNPYHGEAYEDEAELCSMKAQDGTTTCHRYCTAFVITDGKPLTVGFTAVRSDESRGKAVDRVLSSVDRLPFPVKRLVMDRAAYTGEVLARLRATAPPIVPVRCVGTSLREKLTTHSSYWIEHTICAGKEHEQTVPLAINLTYHNGDRGKHGYATHGYVAFGQSDRTPAQVARLYGRRATVEKSYQLFRTARGTTTTPDPVVRLMYVAIGFLLEMLWVVLRWAVFAHPRRGGRVLPDDFPFAAVFLHGIMTHLDLELDWRTAYRTNQVGLPASRSPGFG